MISYYRLEKLSLEDYARNQRMDRSLSRDSQYASVGTVQRTAKMT